MQFNTNPASFTAAAEPTGGELSKDAGMVTFATDGRYELMADIGSQLFAVKDNMSGIIWSSSPDTSEVEGITSLIERNIRSPFEIDYTSDFTKIQYTGVTNADTEYKAYPIENGIQLHYELTKLGIRFVAELVLKDGGLIVRIPEEGVQDGKESAIVSLKVMPLFGAALQGENGYMVVPDGSGALIDFSKLHNQASNSGYSKWIYGMDKTFDPLNGFSASKDIAIPVLGIVKPGGGYIQTLIEGTADAKITINPPGIRKIPYFRGGFELVFRKDYGTSYSDSWESSVVKQVERNRISSDRLIRFDFVAGEDTTYADLAVRASEVLFGESSDADIEQQLAPLIQIFLGVESRGDSYSKRLETMTTFAEAQTIMETLKKAGIANFGAELKGWYNHGYYGRLPERFPVEKAFGGEKGLSELLQWAGGNNIPTALEDNYVDVYRKEKDGVKLRTETVRRPDSRQFIHYPSSTTGWYRRSTPWYKLSPHVVERDYLQQDLKKLASIGVTSVNMRHLGEQLGSDYNSRQPLRRWEVQQHYENWLVQAKDKLGSVGVYYGNAYAAANADRVLDIPLYASADFLFDETVPLLQMVYHGRVPYFSSALNRSDDARLELLKAIEYGAIPSFELTYRNTTDLRYTNYDLLFSSQYETWLPQVLDAYQAWEEALQPAAGLRITRHEKVTDGVFRTTYEDGTQVWVNYNEHMITREGVTIEGLGFTAVKGGGIQ